MAVVAAILLWPSADSPARPAHGNAQPEAPEPALDVPEPQALRGERDVSLWTVVRRPVAARSAPGPGGELVTTLGLRTPEDTPNPVLVLGRSEGSDGRTWVRVRLATLPNGSTGWVPRRALGGYRTVRTRLFVDLGRFRMTLKLGGKTVFSAPIGVGQKRWPTPRGEFFIRNQLVRYRSPFYGPLAFGTSARSAVLTDWPGGGFVGIHGTNRPDLIPGAISHGCIRLRNPDILRLSRLMPVGTPITIS